MKKNDRDQLIQTGRLSSSENFVCKRQKLIFNTFLHFRSMEKYEKISVRELGALTTARAREFSIC